MPYLCEPEVSGQKRVIFPIFPLFWDWQRRKVLNLRFLTKKQVNFWAVYLLSCKLLIINQHNMLHRKITVWKEKQRKSKYKSVKRIISVIFEENLFSLFLRVFCVFTYFFVIFVPRLSPRGTVRDKKLSPEKKGQIARSI